MAAKNFHCHGNPFFDILRLVKASDLIKINQLALLKKFKKGYLPPTIEPLFLYKSDTNERANKGHNDQFATQLPGRFNIGLFLTIEASRSWNNCPLGIKNLPKLKQIKNSLAEFYISKYETQCFNPNCYPCTQNN